MSDSTITIIGGGCSGTLLLVQLIKQAQSPISIILVHAGHQLTRGIAYSTDSYGHLLNVRTNRMSALPDDPKHFQNWILSKEEYAAWHIPDLAERFMPRKIYGHYLEELLAESLKNIPASTKVNIMNDEVLDIEQIKNGYKIILKNTEAFSTNHVALCTGHQAPLSLPGKTKYSSSNAIAINPWAEINTQGLNTNEAVLIIGSSLTMADTVISLAEQNFNGSIYVISRHGQLPLAHPSQRHEHSHPKDFIPSSDLQLLYRQIKDRIRELTSSSTTWHEPVLEVLRPHTQRLWNQFPIQQKEQFLRHLNHRWGRLRHRLPVEIYQFLHTKIKDKQLELIAGNIISIDEKNNVLEVIINDRTTDEKRTLKVQRVINCTGPEANPEKSGNPLFRNLLKSGLIKACPMRLGFDATMDGKIINNSGRLTENFYTMGPGLRGIIWETVAVPELRVQAKKLAEDILKLI